MWRLLWHGRMINSNVVIVDLDEALPGCKDNNSTFGAEEQSKEGERLRHLRVQIIHCYPDVLDEEV